MTAGQMSGKNEVHPRTPSPWLTHQLSPNVWVNHAKMGQAWRASSEPPSLSIDVLVIQSCLTLCNGLCISLMHAILQARILERVAISFFQWIFPTQGLNPGLLHCRQILYHWATREALCMLVYYWKSTYINGKFYSIKERTVEKASVRLTAC